MDRAARKKSELLEAAKTVAILVGRNKSEISMDDVYREMLRLGHDVEKLQNASGSVFRCKRTWEFTGNYMKSERVKTHGHILRKWRLK